jgi:hypothetical protein
MPGFMSQSPAMSQAQRKQPLGPVVILQLVQLYKNILNAFISIQSQTSDIQARLTLLEKYSKDTSLHSNK